MGVNTSRLPKPLLRLALGMIVAVIGSELSRVIDPPFGPPQTTVLLLGYLAALCIAAACLAFRYRLLSDRPSAAKQPLKLAGARAAGPIPPAASAAASPTDLLDPATAQHPFVIRLAEVLKPDIVIAPQGLILEGPLCQAFVLQSRTKGGFTGESKRESLYSHLTESVGGVWTLAADTTSDQMTFTRKAGFPRAVATPLPPRIAASPQAALAMYPDFRLQLGVTPSGPVDVNLARFPHGLFIGGTGTGKSVFNRGVIEQFRAGGFMVFLADGKGTDYTGIIGLPNIVAVSQSTADHMRVVHLFARNLRAAQADAKRHQRQGTPGEPFRRPPAVLLIDEWATVIKDVLSVYGNAGYELIMSDLYFITKIGREFKEHLFLASQEAYRDILPGPLLSNIHLMVSLGPPQAKTIQEVFPGQLRTEAKRIGGTISKNDQGRALILTQDDEGNNQVAEFQSYYAYSPGDPKQPPPQLAKQHHLYKTAVSQRVPKLHPRIWFQVEGPGYRKNTETLYEFQPIALDRADGSPDPRFTKYDPEHQDYKGDDHDETAPPLPSLDELTDDHVYQTPVLPTPAGLQKHTAWDSDSEHFTDSEPVVDELAPDDEHTSPRQSRRPRGGGYVAG